MNNKQRRDDYRRSSIVLGWNVIYINTNDLKYLNNEIFYRYWIFIDIIKYAKMF